MAVVPPVAETNEALAARARRAAASGDVARAGAAYTELLQRDPANLAALTFLALQAHRNRDHDGALRLLDRALAVHPADPRLLRNRAAVHAATGAAPAATADLRAAAAADPASPLALLELGLLLERAGDAAGALAAYAQAHRREARIKDPRSAAGLPAPIPELAERARRVVGEWIDARFDAALEAAAKRHPTTALDRVERAAAAHRGRLDPGPAHPLQRPVYLFVPGLPPEPWIERELLPWADALEARWQDVRADYERVAVEAAGFQPYLPRAPDARAEWTPLAGRPAWNSFFIHQRLRSGPDNSGRCPATVAALEQVPLARSGGVPTEVFFSVLAPGAHIPPHFGLCNAKVVNHLALIVPGGCGIRVGSEQRGWTEGRLLSFDDSFEHEAWNGDPEAHRAVLIFETWNPSLTPAEIDAVAAMLEALEELHAL